MPGLLVVGAGGHGRVVADTALESARWAKMAFLDDRYPEINMSHEWPVLGTVDQAALFLREYEHLVVAIGDNLLRVNLIHRFINMGFSLAAVVHPKAFVSRSAVLGAGSVVFAQAAVNIGTHLGIGTIVNTGATIDHDCIIGDGVHVSPGAHLAGSVSVGSYSWLGIGSSVIQQISIGRNVLLGAGTVVIRNIPDDVTVVGVPGKIIKKREISEERIR